MGFEDTSEEFDPDAVDEDETSVGDEAMDELAGTLSGESQTSTGSEDAVDGEPATDEADAGDEYDPETEPAFPNAKKRIQHSVYVLPRVWEDVEEGTGVLWEAEVQLKREGYDDIMKRELQTALYRAVSEKLSPEDIAEAFIATRDERATDGPLLDDE